MTLLSCSSQKCSTVKVMLMFLTMSKRRLDTFIVIITFVVLCTTLISNMVHSASTRDEGKLMVAKSSTIDTSTIRGGRMSYPGPVRVGGGYTVHCYYCNIFMGTSGLTKPPNGGGGQVPYPSIEAAGGGRPAKSGEYPYVTGVKRNDGSGKIGVCSGAIYDASHVITAAHCLFKPDKQKGQIYQGNDPRIISVTAGTLDFWNEDGKGENIVASHVCVHSSYAPLSANLGSDIAIVKLSKRLDFSKHKRIKPAKFLWNPAKRVEKTGTVAGWGVTLEPSPNNGTLGTSRYLQTAVVEVYSSPRRECNSFSGNASLVMCGGGNEVPPGTCGGDSGSGSPLACTSGKTKYDACGLVSYTTDICNVPLKKRIVFTKNAPYKSWVEEYVRGNLAGCFRSPARETSPPDYPFYK